MSSVVHTSAMSLADSGQPLNDCGCCEGISKETPLEIANRPGLSAIAYRIGAHSQLKETMLAQLSGSRQRALSRLTTRADDDYSIALLDAWATVGDILTFYQERIVNEAYLRTATERVSVRELARLIGYQLSPGVAAATYLAFTIEDAPGARGQVLSLGTTATIAPERLPPVTIDIGTKVQSIPGPGEQAQSFETVEKIEARPEWNAIKPRLTQHQPVSLKSKPFLDSVFLRGTTTNLKAGDLLLIISKASQPVARKILNVEVDDEAKTTRVDFESPQPKLPPYVRPTKLPEGSLGEFSAKLELTENVAEKIISKSWSEEELSALAKLQGWPVNSLVTNIAKRITQQSLKPEITVFVLRQRASIFGYNAPYYDTLRDAEGNPLYPKDWDKDGWQIWKDSITGSNYSDADLYLERSLPGAVRNTWVVLERSTAQGSVYAVYRIDRVTEASLAGFGMSGKATGLRLAKDGGGGVDKPADFLVRKTTVHLESEELQLAQTPIVDPVPAKDGSVTLDRVYLGLKVGQTVILTGERDDLKGSLISEVRKLNDVVIERGFTVITFDQSLTYSYVRKTVTIDANVALATHGETVQEEVLGGGDATIPYQTFALRQPPLTYVSAPTPSGGQTTLEIRVNDLLWREVHSLYDHGPEERIYVTRIDEDGKTTVMFGDGTTGTRLPTGLENVKAKYRKGIGLGGLVKADQLTQLMTRPLGLKGVTNPLAAAGAADSERIEEARRNAPLTVLTLDRIVSLKDYEDFARAFAGIEKALATWTWFGEKRGVFVTVAGPEGAKVEDGSELQKNLLKAMRRAGDPKVRLVVRSYQLGLFRVAAAIKIASDFLPDKVLTEVEQKLPDIFSFDSRAFGQPVHLSEVIEAMQNVRGVVAVDVNEFYRSDEPVGLRARIPAAVPRAGENDMTAAELLILDPGAMRLGVLI